MDTYELIARSILYVLILAQALLLIYIAYRSITALLSYII